MLRRSVVLAFFAIYLMLSCPYLAAKRYDLDDFRIRAEIQPDGRVTVSEAITYDFDGRFSYAFRTIPLKPGVIDFRDQTPGCSALFGRVFQPGTGHIPSEAIRQRCRDSMEFPGP